MTTNLKAPFRGHGPDAIYELQCRVEARMQESAQTPRDASEKYPDRFEDGAEAGLMLVFEALDVLWEHEVFASAKVRLGGAK